MEPDLLKLLMAAREARKQGISEADISAEISRRTNGQFNSAGEVFAALEGREGGFGEGVADFGRAVAQGASFGFGDELAGLVAGILPGGRSREEATALSRERLEQMDPLLRMVGEGVGAVGTAVVAPGAAVARGAGGLTAAGLGAAAGAGGAVAQNIGGAEGSLGERIGATQDQLLLDAVIGGSLGLVGGASLRRLPVFKPRRLDKQIKGMRRALEQAERSGSIDDIAAARAALETFEEAASGNLRPDQIRQLPRALKRAAKLGVEALEDAGGRSGTLSPQKIATLIGIGGGGGAGIGAALSNLF